MHARWSLFDLYSPGDVVLASICWMGRVCLSGFFSWKSASNRLRHIPQVAALVPHTSAGFEQERRAADAAVARDLQFPITTPLPGSTRLGESLADPWYLAMPIFRSDCSKCSNLPDDRALINLRNGQRGAVSWYHISPGASAPLDNRFLN